MIEMANHPRSTIPAVTHVDYSARLQTVHPEDTEVLTIYYRNLKKITGCNDKYLSMLGEPIVMSPEDAIRCSFAQKLIYWF